MKLYIYLLLLMVLCVANLTATNLPRKGKLPPGLWQNLNQRNDFLKPQERDWEINMAQRKDLRLQIALGYIPTTTKLAQDDFALPVLLGAYADLAGGFTDTEFQNHLFDSNPSGSMIDYYDEVSYGQFNLSGQAYGWFTADQNMVYYTGSDNGSGAFPNNAAGFVLEIVQKSDASVDFSLYDNDGPDGIPNSGDDDGYVDAVVIVYAGAGPDWSPSNSNIWPHQFTLNDNAFTTNDASANGGTVIVDAYMVCPERAGSGSGLDEMRPIGVFVHEFGHILGLPDLYDRTGFSEGIGEWCVMASGNWGGDGGHSETPAHMSAWCKYQMGWITPTILTTDTDNLTINQAATNAEAYLLWEDSFAGSRYFLIENRQKTGFDTYLNGDGLLIFHVDESRHWGSYLSSFGPVNDDETHKLVDLEEADGLADLDNLEDRGDNGDVFPGTSDVRTFDDNTLPGARDYDNQETEIVITNISNSGASMTADISVRQLNGYLIKYDEEGLTGWATGFPQPDDSWGGVVFTAGDAGEVAAVDVGLLDINTDYEILVYDGFTGTQPGNLLGSISGNVANNGWHTIDLPAGLTVNQDQDFFVSMKISDKAFAIPFDLYGPKDLRSYFSGDGVSYSSLNSGDINLRVRLKTSELTSIENEPGQVPTTYGLKQNYPNPFNPATTIVYIIKKAGPVELIVYDVHGKKVQELVREKQSSGRHEVFFHSDNLASGIYYYVLNSGNFRESRKMVLLK